MSNIFKEMEKIYSEVLKNEKATSKNDVEGLVLVKEQIELLNEIVSFINSYEWEEGLKQKIRMYLKYKKSINVVSDTLGLSEEAVRKSISRASATLWSKLGTNALKLIREGRIEEARDQFYCLSGKLKLNQYLMSEVMQILPKCGEYLTLDLLDCQKELEFCYDYSKSEFESRYKELDPVKLALIRFIFEDDSPKLTQERTVEKGIIDGKYTRSDIPIVLKELKTLKATNG